jgi:hypothetical protein
VVAQAYVDLQQFPSLHQAVLEEQFTGRVLLQTEPVQEQAQIHRISRLLALIISDLGAALVAGEHKVLQQSQSAIHPYLEI